MAKLLVLHRGAQIDRGETCAEREGKGENGRNRLEEEEGRRRQAVCSNQATK